MHQIELNLQVPELSGEFVSRAERAVRRADGMGDYKASVLARVVASAGNVSVAELFHHSRSRAPIAAIRQLAMYMMHVVLGRSLTQVGRFYGRDRTTVSHACMRIEDMRDDADFDEKLNQLERLFESTLDLRVSVSPGKTPVGAND